MNAKVSIVVPVFNGEKSIKGCLDNLTGQTLREIEIICVNDGSTDSSQSIIEDYMKKDKRIKLVSQKNGGLSAARNTGIKNTKTPFIMFCDCDDIFAKNMCEKMFSSIEENDVDIAACGTEVEYKAHSEIADSDANYYRIKFTGRNYISSEITSKTDVSVCDKIFKMEIIQKNKIEFPEKLNNEDYYFYNAYMSVSKTIFFINQKLYKYIRHDDSIMSENFDKNTYSPDHLLVAQKLFNFYKKNGFLTRHIDYFWEQFCESYWFSYEHSAKKYRAKIQKMAKEFIDKNVSKYGPETPKTRRQVYIIWKNDIVHKIWRFIKGVSARMYRKINIAYQQQDYINKSIEKLEQEAYELSERLSMLEKEK